ncbi:MAG TPA: cation-translocating P-type ATPase [Vicinamibacterales bacterium]|nr:cation-translocating P-type ATPase [Vicinamibacterales bacterium]
MKLPLHALSAGDALASLSTSREGLTAAEAAARLAQYGRNQLTPAKQVSIVTLLLHQLTSVVVWLLAAATGIALLLGDHVEAAAIAAVLVINTLIGFVTELRARRAMEALLKLEATKATVMRDGAPSGIDAHLLVPGDIVLLDAGANVPADGRVIEEQELRTNEAALTGESMPVSKDAALTIAEDTPLADRKTMVYKGTAVWGGTARVVVTATGAATELGKIGALVEGVHEERTPLEIRLDALGRRLIWVALAVAALVAALGAYQGAPLGLVVETGLALAIAAVPEALPTVVTIALAVGMRRMARRNALVRRLPAVETLGSTTVVCTDKTLTLTTGEMTLDRMWIAGGEVPLGKAPPRLLRTAVLASGAADPMDDAILAAGKKFGVTRDALAGERPARGTVPFSSERKYMASFHEQGGALTVYVKGAPGRLLEMSRVLADNTGPRELDDALRRHVREGNEALAREGLRVLAFASGRVDAANEAAIKDLTFEGLGGFVDPPAEGVKEAIATLKGAGLRTIMITGDQKLTAEAIARELGVDGVYSRVSPEEKLRIVEKLQGEGEIVAMLGDGVNDAAALKRADVGVAMGRRGTDVAKEAAAIVLQDDRFGTVAAAVEEGRVIYTNIRKFVFYLFSCNLAEVLVLLGAGVAGLPLPLLPLQLLWLNMVTDTFPALALAMEPGDPDVMRQPPRSPKEAILSQSFLLGVLFYAALITAATLAAYLWALDNAPHAAVTMAFMTLSFAQVLHLGNARSAGAVVRPASIISNPWAIAGAGLAIGLQLLAIFYAPLRDLLELVPLDGRQWMITAGCAAAPAVIGQVLKVLRRA